MFSIGLSLLKVPSIFLTYIGLSIFFNLNLYFLANSKLITNFIAPLSNNTFTVTPSCISILSNPILTVTFLNISSLFRLQQSVLSTTLKNTVNLFVLLRSNQGLLDLCLHLNYYSIHFLPQLFSILHHSYFFCILVFFLL